MLSSITLLKNNLGKRSSELWTPNIDKTMSSLTSLLRITGFHTGYYPLQSCKRTSS